MRKPNVIFVLADQLRYQALGFAGDPNVRTPHLDRLSEQSVSFSLAISGAPVCSPARASLMTGQYPHKHGVFVNDVHLGDDAVSIAQAFTAQGYDTGYIGKWHLDGRGRSNYIPREARQGFDFWRVLECTHDYNESYYYAADDSAKKKWEGYDVIAQTDTALQYIREHDKNKPFFLMLSYGPPHDPYESAPDEYRQGYDPAALRLRPNVPQGAEAQARADLAGYYSHITAIDDQVGELLGALDQAGAAEDTVFCFWSDHGDMLGSHNQTSKQRPWDESIRVPLIIRYPKLFGLSGHVINTPINTPDIPATLMGLCGIMIPETCDGRNYTPFLLGNDVAPAEAALIACYQPFSGYNRQQHNGREYRGIRTCRYTYTRDLTGPWLLYDNEVDPYQLNNLVNQPPVTDIQKDLDYQLNTLLAEYGDPFESGDELITKWGYLVREDGAVPFAK